MSTGRPIGFDPEQIIGQAVEVFRAKGYTGTSLADLVAATRLSRSSLYQSFTSKEALFLRCLDHYCHEFAAQLSVELEQAANARAFIEQTFRNIARRADDPGIREGCLAMNTAVELGHTGSAPARQAHKALQRFAEVFARAVQQGQQEGTIPCNHEARELAYYLVSSMCGLRMLIKCGCTPGEAEQTVTLILRGLD